MDFRSESATPVWKMKKVATSIEITTHKEKNESKNIFPCALEHTEQDCQDDGKPEQPTQDCKGYLQNNSDNEA